MVAGRYEVNAPDMVLEFPIKSSLGCQKMETENLSKFTISFGAARSMTPTQDWPTRSQTLLPENVDRASF